MLWLAFKIAFAQGTLGGGGRPPLSFVGAALFQWVNPKAWLISLATVATYTTADGNLYRQVALLALLFFLKRIPLILKHIRHERSSWRIRLRRGEARRGQFGGEGCAASARQLCADTP